MNEENKGEELKEEKKESKDTKTGRYIWAAVIILAAIVVGLLFYRQKINVEVPKEVKVEKSFTDGWKTFESVKFGFSFKIPQEWEVREKDDYYQIYDDKKSEDGLINVRISDRRSLDSQESSDAIQISMPFDKRNYLIMSTGTVNGEKTYFYNIANTIEMKR